MTTRLKPRPIEPRIKLLVDALNATGLVETFSSCEGHFEPNEPDDYTDNHRANVLFEPVEGVTEETLRPFLGKVYADFVHDEVQWLATFRIAKEYVPDLDGTGEMDEHYAFTIRPFNPHESIEVKRAGTDAVIACITASVKRHSPKK